MKKICLLVIFSLFALNTFANIYVPKAHLSEFYIDDLGNWTLEIGFYERDYWEGYSVDSIFIETSAGRAKIISYSLFAGEGEGFDSLAVITIANLSAPLSINPDGDFVKIESYGIFSSDGTEESFSFGNYPGSMLSCIHSGESFTRIGDNPFNNFAISKTPSIGYNNIPEHAMGTMEGTFYKPDGTAFGAGDLILFHRYFNYSTYIYAYGSIAINANGGFSEDLHARTYAFDTVLFYPTGSQNYQAYSVNHVNQCFRPDTVIYQDIRATGYVEGINSPDGEFENSVITSPNPFSSNIVFYFNLKKSHFGDKLKLLLFSADGKEIEKVDLTPDQKRFDWNCGESVCPGIYIYHLSINNKVVKSGKIIKI